MSMLRCPLVLVVAARPRTGVWSQNGSQNSHRSINPLMSGRHLKFKPKSQYKISCHACIEYIEMQTEQQSTLNKHSQSHTAVFLTVCVLLDTAVKGVLL